MAHPDTGVPLVDPLDRLPVLERDGALPRQLPGHGEGVSDSVRDILTGAVDIRASNKPSRSLKLYNYKEGPTRAFSWLKAANTAFTFKTLLRHYAKWALTPG